MKRADPGSSKMTEHVGYQQWRVAVCQDLAEFSHFPLLAFRFKTSAQPAQPHI